ncbi:MAG: carboxymuconolactone decarboxylase family protein [Phycisphaerae bacterium]
MAKNPTPPHRNNVISGRQGKTQSGQDKLRQLHGDFGAQVLSELDDINPELKKWIIEFGYGTVYESKKLDARTRQITTVTALVCLGHLGREFQSHVRAALKLGITKEEIVGIAEHCALYCGFPAALAATNAMKDIFKQLGK